MRMFRSGRLIAPALFLATGLLVVATDGSAFGQPGKKDKEKEKFKDKGEGPGKAAKDLRKAFDRITDLSQTQFAGKEATRVFDHAKRFYREAVKVYAEDPRRATELAVAANDAGRGLEHYQRALAKPVPGLPEPPVEFDGPPFPPGGPKGKGPPPPDSGIAGDRGPWSEALDALTVARQQLSWSDSGSPATGPARDVLDAAKAAYTQARMAYEAGEYRKATELARATEAWSHVPEHLNRAGWEASSAPPVAPLPKAKGPGAPPPPPLVKER